MKQLREFAQRKADFDARNAVVVGISSDDSDHTRKVWQDVTQRKLTILSDPDAKVIREYGLLHPKGHSGEDIALRATLVVDESGREVYRKVSSSVPDVRTADEILRALK
ncbi:MAG: redoxin domain-containing protein [Acidobacteria bacterium]|nr:redoxin domain-containing protein [Acidobacteriota bacterium]MBV9435229.1 redoxin domain-containing protein [Acidobacteriota bacterium]